MKDKYILSIDSSGKVLAVGVTKNSEPLFLYNEETGLTHSVSLMPKIIEAIKQSNLKIEDIDYFACVNGPGSFTGLRIGIATMKALCNVTKKRMVEISTLDALCENIEYFDGLVCPVIDARRKEVYTAIYDNKNKILNDSNISLDSLFEILKEKNKKVMFVGDGVLSYRDYIVENMKDLCVFPKEDKILINAISISKVALKKINNNETVTYQDFKTSYLKPSQPEMQKNIIV